MRDMNELEREAYERHEQRKRELQQQAREMGGLERIAARAPEAVKRAPPAPASKPDYCSCVKPTGVRGGIGGWHVRQDPEHDVEVIVGRCPAYHATVVRNATPTARKAAAQRELLGEDDDE